MEKQGLVQVDFRKMGFFRALKQPPSSAVCWENDVISVIVNPLNSHVLVSSLDGERIFSGTIASMDEFVSGLRGAKGLFSTNT